MALLVRTPTPNPTESLLGYVLRVSEENGYDTPWHVLRLSGIVQGQMRTAGFPVEKLATVLGVGADTLVHHAYQEFSGTVRHFKILGHRLGQGLNEGPFRIRQPAFCPQCVVELGYIDAFWDLATAVACPRHGTSAQKVCSSCAAPVNWFRPGLLKCKCGAAFDEIEPTPVSEGLRALMSVFYSKLHGMPVSEAENPCGFPLRQLDNCPFGSLIQIARSLGHWNLTGQGLDGQDDEHILLAAVDALRDWPAGFHGMLRRLGEKYLKEGGEAAGLRKQFDSFYGSMFINRDSAMDAVFLRDEFVSFGQFHWGHALIDVKLFGRRGEQEKNEARFISKTDFAKRYGLWKPTMDRLIRTSAISTKRIKTGKTTRVLVDLEKSRLPVDSLGKVTDREAARQVGLPVSVLDWARRVGLYVAKVRGGYESSWHQDDVNEFIERGLALAPGIGLAGEGVPVARAMRLILRDTVAKADIIGAMFDGRLRVIGRSGDNFAGMLLDSKELEEFVRLKRIGVLNDTYSASDVARETGLDSMVVYDAVAKGMLELEVVDGHERLTRRSIDSFQARYVLLVNLAGELDTSARTLLRCCRKHDIPVISLKRKTTGVEQPVLLGADEARLRAVWAARLKQRVAVKGPHNEGEALQTALLRKYLDSLTQRGGKLPRLASRPNRARIATDAGFGRSTFYTYQSLVEMLDIHDATERLQDGGMPLDPLVAVQRYLNQLRDDEMALPIRHGGKPNIVAISKASGCSRHIFDNKGEARRLLNEFIAGGKVPVTTID
jgi:hypothetical protein